ncbi:MAG: HNH endonuclease [Mycobacterium sp.]
MDSNAGVLFDVCAALRVGDSGSAKATLGERYPFVPIEKIVRRFSIRQSMELFMRDGFIDRYTGNRLINPGVLRLLHVVLGDDFPADPHWRVSKTHPAFWELFPTVDHVLPVSRGGRDDESNWVTASMLSNQAKAQWSVGDLGWELYPAGSVEEWDGLSRWLVDYLAANPTVLAEAAEPHGRYIRRWLTATQGAVEADRDAVKFRFDVQRVSGASASELHLPGTSSADEPMNTIGRSSPAGVRRIP